ncbi:MAG: site-specific integrase [Bacteroidia bacterium]|nr:site-specific integrase [Bacteroidia bacterium]
MAIKYKVTTAIILETRKNNQNGTHPVKLRITFDRVQKYYSVGISLTPEDFDKVMFDPKPRGDFKERKILLNSIEEKALEVIHGMEEFSFPEFENLFLSKKSDKSDVFVCIQEFSDILRKDERIGTADSYKCSMNSLKQFVKKEKLLFTSITPEFLKQYEKWMLNNGKSMTTIGIYLRSLRTIFNEQIQAGNLKLEQYPFGKRKYQIPAGRNIKKALTLDDVAKIYNYEVITGTIEAKSKDYWLFSYFCNGINMKDIALLKYQDIDEEKIIFNRAKTIHTSRKNSKPVIVVLFDEITEIIDRLGNKPAKENQYVFPILNDTMTPEMKHARVKQEIQNTNKYIRRIAKAAGIEKDITTYTARHTYSTVLKRSGASIEFISESLGHKNIATTESYLDSFEIDIKKEFAKKLTAFKKL